MKKVTVVGAGLAGCEAALQLSARGVRVDLYEMKRIQKSPAHQLDDFSELVCSNSLKAERLDSAGGLLKHEMDLFGCKLLPIARECRVPAGGALAVDREEFARKVTKRIQSEENITVIDQVVEKIPEGDCIIATGPLTDGKLAGEIEKMRGSLSFYDAASPIIEAESIDRSIVFEGNRYEDPGSGDYLNCPMTKEEYEVFYSALVEGETVELKKFEKLTVFEGCMPIEVMAKRGFDTLSFGPLRPVGFTDPRTGKRPFALVQLRKEDSAGQSYNLVGFQTNLKFGEQKRIFSLIPGLSNAEFTRYGVMHRNTFLDSPGFLDEHFMVIGSNRLFFAGQITGVEGYVESMASGMLSGIHLARLKDGKQLYPLPVESMLGSLTRHVAKGNASKNFQPMNANFGIIPPLNTRIKNKKERYAATSRRSLDILKSKLEELS